MRTYYFDMKSAVRSRDTAGIQFSTVADAIEHCKELARRLRKEPRCKESYLLIVIVDESGAEDHRENVHPEFSR